jgi:hypothetical protein
MSNVPLPPNNPFPDQNIPAYGTPAPGRNGLALWSMILGIIAIPTTFVLVGVAIGMVALVLGIIGLVQIGRNPYQGGKGMAIVGIVLGGLSFTLLPIIALLIAILIPSLGRAKELANRAACGANITGITKALNLYAAENADQFPVVQFAPYGPAQNNPSGVTVGNAADTLSSYYGSLSTNQAGSPTACVWMLVLKGNVGPKQFICKADPTGPMPSDQTDAAGNFYNNFQHGSQMSYSFSYPWDSKGDGLGSWRSTVDSSLPIAADMAPLDGTGTPTRSLGQTQAAAMSSPFFPKNVNSANHSGGEGQNVGFADTHVEWSKHPYVGQGGDSIWTQGAGNTPVGPGPIGITTTSTPFDTVLVPVRNASTGGM